MYKYTVKFKNGDNLFEFETDYLLSENDLLQSPETGERYKIAHRIFMVDSTMTLQRTKCVSFTLLVTSF